MKKRNVGILIFNQAEVLDFAGPFEVFSVCSEVHDHKLFDVSTIAKQKIPVTAVNGLSVNPDHSFKDAPRLDILIISGGAGARAVVNDDTSLQWIESSINRSELSMSICSGAAILAKIGLLDEKPFTTHHEVFEYVSELAPTAIPLKSERFVKTDERLYTSGGISAGIDLSFHIVEQLHGKEVADRTAEYMEYERNR